MTLTHTHTYVILNVSDETYREIHDKLLAAGYEDQFNGEEIDMHGLALAPGPAPEDVE